ncbi:MAG: S41 family peptidase [Fimbriimonadales bacterium]|nr:S41 family peptidase [Fimbriimonadales bacterium]
MLRHLALAALAAAALARADIPKQTRLQSFEIVWSRVNDHFFDPKFGGVDWAAIKERYRQKVEVAGSDAEYLSVLNAMLGELPLSHFGVIPSAAYASGPSDPVNGSGETGISIGWVEGRPTVVEVAPGSPAASAGVKPGWILLEVDSRPVAPVVRAIWNDPAQRNLLNLKVAGAMRALLAGPVGQPVQAVFLDGRLRKVSVSMRRAPAQGQIVRFGELPPIRARIEQRRLPGGIGYIRFNVFMMPLLEPLQRAIGSYRGAPGLILDLRGNPGGVGAMAIPIAAKFVDAPASLGIMRMRAGETRFRFSPQPPLYSGRLVVLIDGTSASTSEILAAGLQELGRAKLVGSRTAGAVLPSVVEKLPCGNRLQYAFADFRTPKGVLLEGRGALPDVEVRLTHQSLLRDGDPVLRRALELLRGNRGAQAVQR